ncbi:hypothetical protein [Comamonas antarctica]|uniref:hypothetical protein n=1 Tax=Comamonas antarctica TaxID=2743470 RepID=UPI0028EB89AF|nr:hypothetical protein [Comamonas antarctica]
MRHLLCTAACALLCLGGASLAHAQADSAPQEQLWLAVADTTLSEMRGGFALGDGLMVTLGITRALYINGALVTETRLHLNPAEQLNSLQAAQLGQQLQSLNLVQNGPGNVFQSGSTQTVQTAAQAAGAAALVSSVTGLGPGTIVQNSLDGQNILNQTTINATSSGLSMMRAAQLQSDISQAVQQAIGAR